MEETNKSKQKDKNEEGKKTGKESSDQNVEFSSRNDERINSSNTPHSSPLGGTGSSDSERDIISK